MYFTPRPRSRTSVGSGGDTGGDESGDEDDHGDDDGEAGGVKSNEVVPKADGGDDEVVEVDGYDDVEGVHMHTLAYHMGGTPHPTPCKGSPWSSGSKLVQSPDPKPEPQTVSDVQSAIQKLEYLEWTLLGQIMFDCLVAIQLFICTALTYFMTSSSLCCFQFHCRQAMAERRISVMGRRLAQSWSSGDLIHFKDSIWILMSFQIAPWYCWWTKSCTKGGVRK